MSIEKGKNLILTQLWHVFLMVAIPVICVSGVSLFPFKLRLPLIYLTGILSVVFFVFSGKKIRFNIINISMLLLVMFIAIQMLYSYDRAATKNLLILYACATTVLFIDIPQDVIHKIITIILSSHSAIIF